MSVSLRGPGAPTVMAPSYGYDAPMTGARGAADRGILVCGTGIGMSIAANKIPGIRAALVHDRETAEMAARHNDANVLCLGGRLLAEDFAIELVDIWLATGFEERHAARLKKITQLETSG